ncbi:hypothetical protein K450DRAFT_222092 [Umbelopsis ramanniana AG]|uniref:RNA polymerase II assembly factor Rtp1 C-terminal domain-containing protein n=1 Tax=Umbelopsis ramanniana AG TaxID=1314678 RepID=A0AAD5EI44_UMBRA|nr:uncharacterized protein K450DRAFT_222092 [Umbelopsis ramanniana AG]KAI8583639.1 hypothetical protein K450DRAFT_222092 [Umbelopsis ramanniana AG]
MASPPHTSIVLADASLKGVIANASKLIEGSFAANEKDEKQLNDQLAKSLAKLDITEHTDGSDQAMDVDIPTDDIKWQFVLRCLEYLKLIQRELNSKVDSEEAKGLKELLGVKDLRVVHTLLEIVITWGEYPQLLNGVGLPLKQRVKSGYANRGFVSNSPTQQEAEKSLDIGHLSHIMTELTDIIQSKPKEETYTSVASILLNRHLIDIYAGLLQMAYAPFAAIEKEQSELSKKEGESAEQPRLSPFQVNAPQIQIDREKFVERFQHLFKSVDSYKSMESLSLLLGTSPLHPVPNWLRSICGRFLSQVLLRPKGVAAVLDFSIGGVQEVKLAQMEKLSTLITTLPFQVRSVESYLSVLCPQLIDIIAQGIPDAKTQVVSFIIAKLMVKYRSLSEKYLIDPVIGFLAKSWDQDQCPPQEENLAEDSFDPVVISEERIRQIMTTIHTLLVSAEPSPEIIQAFLSSSVPALYHLYQFSHHSKSGLKDTTGDILTTYFRIVSTSEATMELKRILFDKKGDKRLAYFAPGPTGGVVMRLHKKPPVVAGDHLQVDTNIFVDFIQTIGIQTLCGDFFVALLNEYFSLQAESGRSVAPKIILMVLNLIMTMLDKLGPTILQNPTQIIAFASNVIDSHLMQADHQGYNESAPTLATPGNAGLAGISNLVSQEDNFEDAMEGDDEAAIMEDDLGTLFLAVNLLGAVLNENDELDKQAKQLLGALLPKLQVLQNHPIPAIQESARELSLVIKSREAEENVSDRMAGSNNANMQSSIDTYKQAMEALRDELMPVRAHGMGMLKNMVLAKDPLVAEGKGLDEVLDIFVNMVQDDDSFIYLNAVKGLCALTDVHGNKIITKLAKIYADPKRPLDHRLRIGEALQQTVQRCGEALGKYVDSLLEPLEAVLGNRETDKHLRVSALSIIGVACQTCPVALTDRLWSLMHWILTILDFEKEVEIRRAATVVILSLFRGFASQTLYSYPADLLKKTYRTLRYVEDTDKDELTRYQARVALSDLDTIMRNEIFH